MDNTNTPGGSSDFQQQLLVLRQDPQVRRRARSLVGDADLALDLIQAVYCKLAGLKYPERINNLRAYCLRVMRNEAAKVYALHQETPLEDLDSVPAQVRAIDDMACSTVQSRCWLKRLAAQRGRLLADIPARSHEPARYRAVIYSVADQVLRDGINGEASKADTNDALRAAYPAYFNQPGVAVNTCHQRFRRAREDVRALLREVVNRDELT